MEVGPYELVLDRFRQQQIAPLQQSGVTTGQAWGAWEAFRDAARHLVFAETDHHEDVLFFDATAGNQAGVSFSLRFTRTVTLYNEVLAPEEVLAVDLFIDFAGPEAIVPERIVGDGGTVAEKPGQLNYIEDAWRASGAASWGQAVEASTALSAFEVLTPIQLELWEPG